MADRRGRIPVWIASFSAPLQQHFTPPFCLLNAGYQCVTIRHLPAFPVVLRSEFLNNGLHLVAILLSVVVPFVQDQPKLEAWIGTANPNTVPSRIER